jgi:hypothetical protein
MLNEAPDIRPVDRKSGVRTQLRSSAACIEFQAASKAVAQMQELVKMAWYCVPKLQATSQTASDFFCFYSREPQHSS